MQRTAPLAPGQSQTLTFALTRKEFSLAREEDGMLLLVPGFWQVCALCGCVCCAGVCTRGGGGAGVSVVRRGWVMVTPSARDNLQGMATLLKRTGAALVRAQRR
jgi:hypothetical protein